MQNLALDASRASLILELTKTVNQFKLYFEHGETAQPDPYLYG